VATAATGALTAALLSAPAAWAGVILPESDGGSPNAEKISTLYLVAFIIGALIFVLVEGILIYSLVKFRWRRGGTPPAQIRGNTPLEIGWTVGAAAILIVLTVVTFIFLGPIKNPAESKSNGLVAEAEQSGLRAASADPSTPDGKGTVKFASLNQSEPPGPKNTHLNIKVNGQQFLWRYNYPGDSSDAPKYSYYEMVVPTNTTVTLDITSSDVDHSWWIPDLGGKADAIPGYTNHTWFRISEPGTYKGNCAELCGDNHAEMRAQVRAVSPGEYEKWLAQQASDLKQAQALLALSRKTRAQSGP
jgi:cytochrome c oxidase subunit 2